MKKRRAPGPIICTKDIKESRSSTWCETFTHFSLHVTFYLLLICFCWLLVVSAGYWLLLVVFCSKLGTFLLVVCCVLLVARYFFAVACYFLLVCRLFLHGTRYFLLVVCYIFVVARYRNFLLLHNFVSWNT